ncbi:hypothetical protein [Sandarakinorhabdus sp. DWP1-3-1]|uniref:hypothetical protein n=1 Tax=Sandarakinorhabdus sp. DWP1-3-1 TaxID=2804627 RepID=UPI003CF53ACA
MSNRSDVGATTAFVNSATGNHAATPTIAGRCDFMTRCRSGVLHRMLQEVGSSQVAGWGLRSIPVNGLQVVTLRLLCEGLNHGS